MVPSHQSKQACRIFKVELSVFQHA